MKTFVALIGTLVLATAAVWFINRGGATPRVPPRAEPSAQPSPTGTPLPAALPVLDRDPDAAGTNAAPAPVTGAARPSTPTPSVDPAGGAPETATAPPHGHNAYHAASASLSTTRPILPPSPTDSAANSKPTPSDAAPPESAEHDTPAEIKKTVLPEGAKFILGPETEVKKEDDGWTRLDGRFLVRGSGTKDDPMIVPWELLVSASETYRPRTGLKEMPRRVADLKGKHVRITGYALFPLMSMETTELLLMRNQWDGCCIGVPPTPYDAVEIKLAKPADRKDTFISFVSIEGVLDVDPYVNRDFLLGLYTMSDASVSQPAKGKDDEKGL